MTDGVGTADGIGAADGALLVVGDVVTDIVALHSSPLAPHTDTAARIAVRPGGSGANTAAWAARAGAADVRLLARVGADAAEWHGSELLGAGVVPHLAVDGELSRLSSTFCGAVTGRHISVG